MSTTAELEIVEIEPGQKLDATVPALRDAGWSDELIRCFLENFATEPKIGSSAPVSPELKAYSNIR